MSMTPGTAVPPVSVAFGKYQLVERLGRGGMAEVWKARMVGPAGFQRTLVVKRILPHLVEDPHFVEMFVSEARLSARLNHVNIVQVYELGDVNGEYFLAMEYVRGRDLVNVMQAQLMRGHPDPGLGAYAMREVCRALAYAHALTDDNGTPFRLIHRDVSPSNVMLSFDGAVKLLDFGIAKALAEATENKTQTGTLKGKFGYMSPEQVEGRDFDHRADLFAAGVVLHESLSGRRLFKGSSDLQTIAMVRDAKVEPPSVTNPNVPPELDRIALKALARNPDDRYPSCEEMAFDLDQVVHQLKFGPETLKPILRDLFADEPSHTGALVQGQKVGSGLTIGTLRQHERRKIFAYVAAGLVAVGGIAWLVTAKARRPPEVKPPLVSAPIAPVVMPMPPPPSAVVRVRVSSSPPGAEVFLTGDVTARGVTPLTMMLPRSTAPLELTLKAKGFRPESAEVTPDSDGTLQISLSEVAAPAAAPKKIVRRPVVPKKKPAANLKRGDVVDPFSR